MKFSETFHFDEEEYMLHICDHDDATLEHEIKDKRRKCFNAGIRATVNGVTINLVGLCVSGRTIHVDLRKLHILEREWTKRGKLPVPKEGVTEKIISAGVAVGTSMLTAGLDMGASDILGVDTLVHQAAESVGACCTLIVTKCVEEVKDELMESGLEKCFEAVAHHFISSEA